MLGELHGENEIPALIRNIWPSMWKAGYRHVAAEVSPWAADRLEFPVRGEQPPFGLWTQPEVTFVKSLKTNDRRYYGDAISKKRSRIGCFASSPR